MNRFTFSLLALIFSSISSWAISVTCTEGELENLVTDNTVSELTITGSMDARDFSFIYNNLTNLTTLDISNVTIKAYTCSGSESYFGIRSTFNANVIPQISFFGSSIQSIKLPQSLVAIDYAAFAGCKSLTAISIPATVTEIGPSAFYNSGLTSVEISAPTIGENAFARCENLASATISTAVRTIGSSAFMACKNLASVEIPAEAGLEYIGDNAFAGTALTNFQFAACPNLTYIGKWAFAGTAMVSINLPEGISEVPEGVLFGNKATTTAKTVTSIPYSATSVGNYAYYGNSNLKRLFIPNNVTYIGDNAFEGTGITVVGTQPMTPPELGVDVFKGVNDGDKQATLYVNKGAETLYQTTDQWKDFIIEIDSVSSVKATKVNRLKAYFNDRILLITASTNILGVNIADETGMTLTAASPEATTTSIDTEAMMGRMYIVRVTLDDNSVETIKLLRK